MPAETLLGLLQHQQASTELFRALLPGHREPGSGGALGRGGGGLFQAPGNNDEDDDLTMATTMKMMNNAGGDGVLQASLDDDDGHAGGHGWGGMLQASQKKALEHTTRKQLSI